MAVCSVKKVNSFYFYFPNYFFGWDFFAVHNSVGIS